MVSLVLPHERDHPVLAEFAGMPNLDVVYGDLTDYPTVEACVARVDYVLHVAAVVSLRRRPPGPRPGGQHRQRPQHRRRGAGPAGSGSRPRGDGRLRRPDRGPQPAPPLGPRRRPPAGVPLRRVRADQGRRRAPARRLRPPRWAWLRQTGIFHPGMLDIRDPIMRRTPCSPASWSGPPPRTPPASWPTSARTRSQTSSGAASTTSAAGRTGG
ncbi:hypothetical protein ACU686_25050 [Yinghuangia aomiensis]